MRRQVQRIELIVEGEPKPQPRPMGNARGGYVRMIATPSQSACAPFRENLNIVARRHMAEIGALAATGPVFIEIDCVWKRTQALKKVAPDKRIWRAAKDRDDWDNLAKSVCDALNGVLYEDDSQIVGGTVRKYYGRVGEVAHVRIVLRALTTPQETSEHGEASTQNRRSNGGQGDDRQADR